MNATRIGSRREYLYASTTATTDETGDLDYIAIEHALNGKPVQLNLAEKVHAARILHDRGLTLNAISRHVGSDSRTITAWQDNDWKPIELQPCGTRAAYLRHRKKREDCPTCRAANTAADQRYRHTGSRKETAV